MTIKSKILYSLQFRFSSSKFSILCKVSILLQINKYCNCEFEFEFFTDCFDKVKTCHECLPYYVLLVPVSLNSSKQLDISLQKFFFHPPPHRTVCSTVNHVFVSNYLCKAATDKGILLLRKIQYFFPFWKIWCTHMNWSLKCLFSEEANFLFNNETTVYADQTSIWDDDERFTSTISNFALNGEPVCMSLTRNVYDLLTLITLY